MNEYMRVGVAVVAAVVLGPKVEAQIASLIKPEGDFAARAVKWGAPVATGIGAFALTKMFMGASK